jgi:hypothetical protein
MFRRMREHTFNGAEGQFLESFNHCVDQKWAAASSAELDRNMRAICEHVNEPPWPLLNTISDLFAKVPAARESIVRDAFLDTGRPFEQLRLSKSGVWQVSWRLTDPPETDEDTVALDWHQADAPGRTPITPFPIVESIAACVALYRSDLILAALAVLTMAYESALWDALDAAGVSRSTTRTTYNPAKWKVKRVSDKLVVEIEGADDSLKNLESTAAAFLDEFEVRLRRTANSGDNQAEIAIKPSGKLVKFLSTEQVEGVENDSTRGLRNAVELARAKNIKSITTVPKPLDNTFIEIRNNLVHFPASGKFAKPIPILGRDPIDDIYALATDKRLFVTLLTPVIGAIETTYGEPPAEEAPVASATAPA